MNGSAILQRAQNDFLKFHHANKEISKTMFEVGSTRDYGSTQFYSSLANQEGFNFVTVDSSEDSHNAAKKHIDQMNNENIKAVLDSGENYSKNYDKKDIFIAYLDGFDIVTDWPHKQSTIDFYTKQGIDLIKDGNKLSAESHLTIVKNLEDNFMDECYICFDDSWLQNGEWFGKGKTAIPYLITKGFVVDETFLIGYPKPYNNGILLVRKAK